MSNAYFVVESRYQSSVCLWQPAPFQMSQDSLVKKVNQVQMFKELLIKKKISSNPVYRLDAEDFVVYKCEVKDKTLTIQKLSNAP